MTIGESTNWGLPIVLIVTLLAIAAIAYIFRRWEQTVAPLVALIIGSLALWLWNLDLSIPVQRFLWVGPVVDVSGLLDRFGFSWQVQSATLPILVGGFLIVAGGFLLALVTSQGHSFVPLTLIMLVGYTLITLVTAGPLLPPLLVPLALIVLSSLGVFVLQAGRLTHPAGPLRTLVPPVLAFPLFLFAAWYIEQMPLNPQDSTMPATAGWLLGFGLLLLLAPVPFSAQPATAQSSPPLAAAVVTLLYQLALLHLYFRIVSTYPFVAQQPVLIDWLTYAGLATTIWGGIAAAGALHPGRLWGYSALHDWGLIIMILATPIERSWPLALFLFGLRAVSMLTAAAGLTTLVQHVGGYRTERWQGAGNRLPWNSAAFLLGGLGLVGFPLSAGFTGHWAALQIFAETDWQQAAIVLLSSGGAIFGYIRTARILFGPLSYPMLRREQAISAGFAVVALLISVSLAVSPQLMNGPINRVLAAFGG